MAKIAARRRRGWWWLLQAASFPLRANYSRINYTRWKHKLVNYGKVGARRWWKKDVIFQWFCHEEWWLAIDEYRGLDGVVCKGTTNTVQMMKGNKKNLTNTFNSSASIPGGCGGIQGQFTSFDHHPSKYHLGHRNGRPDKVVRPEFKPNVTFLIVD